MAQLKAMKDTMKDGVCPKCASHEIIAGMPVMDHSYAGIFSLSVELFEKPLAFLFKGRRSTGALRARICGRCGYTELLTDNHQQLYATCKRSKGQRGSR